MYKHAKSKKPEADIGLGRFVVAHYWPNKGRSVRSFKAWTTNRQAKKEYDRLAKKGGERLVRLLVDGEIVEEFGYPGLRDLWFEQNPGDPGHQRFQAGTGLPYVRVRFKPAGKRARWYWAVQVGPKAFYVLDKYGEPKTKGKEKDDGVIVSTTDMLVGEPVSVRPAGLSLRYGEMEEVTVANPARTSGGKAAPHQMVTRCRKLWEAYDGKPTKGRLVTLTDHLEKMKDSRSVAVKSERSRALRVVNREWKAQGWVKPKPRRNPVNPWKAKRDAISEKYGIEKFHSSYHPRDRHLSVDLISVLEESRGEGRASGAMKDTLDWADANGVTVTVSPTSEFGSSKRRLEKWYRSMGFVPNKGRNKDFRFTDAMIRLPRGARMGNPKRNPIHHSPRHEVEIHVLDKAGWYVILEPSSIEGPDESTINAVQLVDPDNDSYYAMVTRSAREPGRWQATRFDERGPVGHSTKDTLIEAVNDTRKWYGLTVSEVVSKNPSRKARWRSW